MPGADASQFTRFKRAGAIQSNPNVTDRLTQYFPVLRLARSSNDFLPSLTLKNVSPLLRTVRNTDFKGKKDGLAQNCS